MTFRPLDDGKPFTALHPTLTPRDLGNYLNEGRRFYSEKFERLDDAASIERAFKRDGHVLSRKS